MLQIIHSTLAYAVLAVLVLAVINAFLGLSAKRNFTSKDRSISLIALIFSHIQLLVGLFMWASTFDFDFKALGLVKIDHPITNILAIALITIGWSKHKKEESSNGKFKKIGIFYVLGLIFLLSRIPFKHWLGL
jgi:NADH:ubiquinone oxidoreductase subunit 2 (subunit N)